VELQTGPASVIMDRISDLYRVSLSDCVGAEYRARKGEMLQNTSVAFLATVCRCRVSPFLGIQFDPRKITFVMTGVVLQPV
jgi:hypothetical protein